MPTLHDVMTEKDALEEISKLLSMASHPSTDFGAKVDYVERAGELAFAQEIDADRNGCPFLADRWNVVRLACEHSTIADAREALRAI